MAVFPKTSKLATPIIQKPRTKTIISKFGREGKEQRKSQWNFARRDLVLQFRNISKSDAREIWQFYLDRDGQYEAFLLFYPYTNTYEKVYVGTGDGSTTVFNLPCKQSSARTLYVNMVAQSEGSDYTFSALGGTDGADKITFTTAPTNGYYILLDFTGYLKIVCRFTNDTLDFETLYDVLVNFSIQLTGLLNDEV